MSESMTIQGRKLFTEDIELIRRMMADNPNWHRSRLSIENLFSDPCFLKAVKKPAAKLGFRFKGFKPTSIRLLSGRSLPIESPYFAKALPKSRRGRKRKKRKTKSGIHLGLAYLGFMDRCSAVLASASVQASLLCPSFEIANRTLSSFGIDMDIKTIRRLCMHMGNRAMENRHRVTLSENAIPFGVNS
jgi:hypothetical protein